jgi:hypothetical protein
MIYDGKLNPWDDLPSCRVGRIKKETTAGGCQAAHISTWNKVRGFDENMIQWGSEDYDLYTRMSCQYKTIWMGEDRNEIRVFHQPHYKSQEQVKTDLKYQEENKKLLALSFKNPFRVVNCSGWGGKGL